MLKAAPLTRLITVMALRGNAMTGNREKVTKAGCYNYETKPIEFTRLTEKIKALVGEKAAP